MSSALQIQVGNLARRSVIRTLRQPVNIVPALLFPTLFLAVTAGGLHAATQLPGFPSDSYLDFFIAFSFLQGAIFATMNAGTDLAKDIKDIQTGFLNRLALTPLRGSALLGGHLSGAVLMGLLQSIFYLSVGLAAGVHIVTGVAGALVILLLSVVIVAGFAAIGAMLALRTGTGEAIQGMFPLFFVLLFLSSMSLPRNLIEADWFRALATINPVTYLIEAIRSLIITGWDAQALALGFGIAIAILAVGLTGAALALRGRLART
jgi:ABC-2 type transport system permease protein